MDDDDDTDSSKQAAPRGLDLWVTDVAAQFAQIIVVIGGLLCCLRAATAFGDEKPEIGIMFSAAAMQAPFLFALAGGVRALVHLARHTPPHR